MYKKCKGSVSIIIHSLCRNDIIINLYGHHLRFVTADLSVPWSKSFEIYTQGEGLWKEDKVWFQTLPHSSSLGVVLVALPSNTCLL